MNKLRMMLVPIADPTAMFETIPIVVKAVANSILTSTRFRLPESIYGGIFFLIVS